MNSFTLPEFRKHPTDLVRKILVVDDDADLLESLGDLLEANGYDVRLTPKPGHAASLAKFFEPDLALVDIMLGLESGLDLIPILKSEVPGMVCMVMTGMAGTDTAVQALRHDADDYLHKPLDPDLLLQTISRLLDRQQLGREKEAADKRLRDGETRLRGIMESVADGLVTIDETGIIESFNPAAESLFGYTADEALGNNVSMLMPEPDRSKHDGYVLGYLRSGVGRIVGASPREVTGRRKDGSTFPLELAVGELALETGRVFIGTMRNISERKVLEEDLRHVSTHDALTGLPNRTLLLDRLLQSIRQAERGGGNVAVIFADLDRFKIANDSLGHAVGDEILQQVARRLCTGVRKADTVARLGGDEFVIASIVKTHEDAARIAEKIIDSLSQPFHIAEQELSIGVSIGISISTLDGADPNDLIRNADIAMYDAKKSDGNCYRYFTAAMNQTAMERLELPRSLRRALENEEFVLQYQPQIDTHSGRVMGAEALIRWRHPEKGEISPLKFIPVAEEVGLISDIGEWVINEACREAASWSRDGLGPIRLAVNVSASQFNRSDLVGVIKNALETSGLPARQLNIEITESLFLNDEDENVDVLNTLTAQGIQVSIDDFGNGFSSLGYLRDLPIDSIKVDRAFIKDIGFVAGDKIGSIATAIVSLSHALNLGIVAEGVENQEQLEFLRGLGCRYIQGFYFSQPLSAEDFREFVRNARNGVPGTESLVALENSPDGRAKGVATIISEAMR